MSGTGHIIVYSCVPTSPEAAAADVLRACEVERLGLVTRTLGPDREWQSALRLHDPRWLKRHSPKDAYQAYHSYGFRGTVERLEEFFAADSVTRFSTSHTSWIARLDDAVQDAIPQHVRGDFRIGHLDVAIGWHDLFDLSRHSRGQYIARAFLSVDFWGYGAVPSAARFRTEVTALDAFLAIKTRIEAVAGSLESDVVWYT